jgi:exodeoxyribonuclease V gamma subunit
MLHVFHSNRMECLVERLGEVLRQPLADPLEPERFVVQNTGLARWLGLRLAERFGIAANHDYRMPSSFLWWLLGRVLEQVPETSPFDREELFWRLFRHLSRLPEEAVYAPLRDYLEDDPDDLKRCQLARRIADLFDQYLVYRPDWVLGWEQGRDDHWQARLWRLLRGEIQGEHRAGLQRALLAADLTGADLPQRVLVFGIASLPPAVLEVLRHLSGHSEVYLFVLNPSDAYWGDLLPPRTLARRRERWREQGLPDLSGYFDTGNPLLASWGGLGRDFQRLLYADNVPDEDEAFVPAADDRLLGKLQNDLLTLRDRTGDDERESIPKADDSLEIQACHSPLREVEVLHDRLLALLDRHPDLEPRDLVVMTPDIDRYAPYVEAVFGSAPEERRIPWALADVSQRRESPLAELPLRLLELPDSRFTAGEVLSLLEVPAVQRRLGMTESDLPLVRGWVREAGVRWGRDAEARRRLGQEDGELNTWRHGFRRLFFGYALPDSVARYGQVAPVTGVEGSALRLLGALKGFVDRLERLADLFGRPHPASDWQAHLLRALDELLDAGDDEPALDRVRAALQSMAEGAQRAGVDEALRSGVVKALLQGELDRAGAQHRYAGGRVTFCAMVPMRAVPFRVVALLGLNDSDYPRRQRPLSFDLMAGNHRPGDRSVREEDRHLFLEALLSARDYLLLSYLAADARDGSALEPALMLSELRDYVEAGFLLERPLTVEYPLQPFSSRYRQEEGELRSYAREWLLGADVPQAEQAFCATPLAPSPEPVQTLDLEALIRFFRAPAAEFLRQRLGVRLSRDEAPLQDEEPFGLNRLERYLLRAELLQVGGDDLAERLELLRLRGSLPRGAFADLALAPDLAEVQALRTRMAEEGRPALEPRELDIPLGGLRLVGWLRGLDEGGLLHCRAGGFGGAEMVEFWLRHLALNALEDAGLPRASRYLVPDGLYRLAPLEASRARALLGELTALYRRGQSQPLNFFPRTSWAYVQKLGPDGDEGAAFRVAFRNWEGDALRGVYGESQEEANAIAYRGTEPLGGEFPELAERVFGPALQCLEP